MNLSPSHILSTSPELKWLTSLISEPSYKNNLDLFLFIISSSPLQPNPIYSLASPAPITSHHICNPNLNLNATVSDQIDPISRSLRSLARSDSSLPHDSIPSPRSKSIRLRRRSRLRAAFSFFSFLCFFLTRAAQLPGPGFFPRGEGGPI